MNHNPFQARLEKRRRSKSGTLERAKTTLWKAIKEAETILLSEESEPELKLRCVHALSQAIGQYAKVTEVGELEARLEALEAKQRAA